MTAQVRLDLVWGSTGSATPTPTDGEYTEGWVVEIPTFEEFNYVLQNFDRNILHFAESGSYDWMATISYAVGGKVLRSGILYTCKLAHIGQDPDLDTNNDYWVYGSMMGGSDYASLLVTDGFKLDMPSRPNHLFTGVDMTVSNFNPMIELRTDEDEDSLSIANVSGELVVTNLGKLGPDGRDLDLDAGSSFRVFHEGHLPTVAEVTDAVEEAPIGTGILYARRSDSGWVPVTSTSVSDVPPAAPSGQGTGWYNTENGQLYIDIEDESNSSQWVPANPPVIPEFNPTGIPNATATTMQDAIAELYSLV